MTGEGNQNGQNNGEPPEPPKEEECPCQTDCNLFKARMDYAWNYFTFHARQRTTMFNFFIVFSGLLLNGCVLLYEKHSWQFLLVASVLGIFITIFFIFLERRNEELVHAAEDILFYLEKEKLFADFERDVDFPNQRNTIGILDTSQRIEIPLGFFMREEFYKSKGRNSRYSHGRWLPIIQCILIIPYLIFAIGAYQHLSFDIFGCFCDTG